MSTIVPVGQRADNHLLQFSKQARYRYEIYQVINRLGKEIDPVLHAILIDGIRKYLNGTRQTKYIVSSKYKPKKDYWDQIREVSGESAETTEVEDDTDDY